MRSVRTTGIILIVVGIILFSYAGIVEYRTERPVLDAGPVHVTKEETHTVRVPPVLGSVALIAGVVMIITAGRRT